MTEDKLKSRFHQLLIDSVDYDEIGHLMAGCNSGLKQAIEIREIFIGYGLPLEYFNLKSKGALK